MAYIDQWCLMGVSFSLIRIHHLRIHFHQVSEEKVAILINDAWWVFHSHSTEIHHLHIHFHKVSEEKVAINDIHVSFSTIITVYTQIKSIDPSCWCLAHVWLESGLISLGSVVTEQSLSRPWPNRAQLDKTQYIIIYNTTLYYAYIL